LSFDRFHHFHLHPPPLIGLDEVYASPAGIAV
jgi:hypothetical protein